MRLRSLAVLAVLLAGCTTAHPTAAAAPTPAAAVTTVAPTPTPSPSVSVLATHAPKPTPKPAVKPKPKPVVHHKAAPKPVRWPKGCGVTKICCVQYAQCKIPPITASVWKKTVGCTVAWRKALHRTTCPPGWPPIP